MIKAVIFDLDHTLYDRYETYVKLMDSFMERFEGQTADLPREELMEKMVRADKEGLYYRDWPGIFDHYLMEGVFKNPPTYDEFYAYLKTAYPPCVVLHDDAIRTMEALHAMGLKTAILTNGEQSYQYSKIEHTELPAHMDDILASREVGVEKPDPKPFLASCERLGIQPEEAIYVGDNPLKDVDASRKIGMTPVWIRYAPPWPGDIEPTPYEIDKLYEVVDIVKKINA